MYRSINTDTYIITTTSQPIECNCRGVRQIVHMLCYWVWCFLWQQYWFYCLEKLHTTSHDKNRFANCDCWTAFCIPLLHLPLLWWQLLVFIFLIVVSLIFRHYLRWMLSQLVPIINTNYFYTSSINTIVNTTPFPSLNYLHVHVVEGLSWMGMKFTMVLLTMMFDMVVLTDLQSLWLEVDIVFLLLTDDHHNWKPTRLIPRLQRSLREKILLNDFFSLALKPSPVNALEQFPTCLNCHCPTCPLFIVRV